MAGISSYVADSPFAGMISQSEQDAGIPSGLLGAQLYQESTLGTQTGNGGGIGQFIPSTANEYGVDTSDNGSGIDGAASYLSDLYQQTGSWVSALQGYGTLPSGDISNASLTAGQQNVYNIASNADNGTTLDPITGYPVDNQTGQPVAGGKTTLAGKDQGTLIPGNNLSIPSWLKELELWVGGGLLRVLVFVIALFVIIIGIADLAFGKSPQQLATTIVKAGKSALVE